MNHRTADRSGVAIVVNGWNLPPSKKPEPLRRAVRRLPAMILAAVFLLPTLLGAALAQVTPAATPAPATAAATPIPQAEVATQATELTDVLSDLTAKGVAGAAIETIQQSLPEFSRQIEQEFAEIVAILQQQPTLDILQEQQQSWRRRQLQADGWLNSITQRAIDLRQGLSRLANLQTTWSATLDAARATAAPEPILRQIEAALAAIQAAQSALQAHQVAVLELQSRVALEVTRCNEALSRIVQAQRSAVGGLLTRALPIWSAELWRQARAEEPGRVRQIAARHWGEIQQYLRDPSQNLPLHLGVFATLALLMALARQRVRRWRAADKRASFTVTVFDHPYAAAFVATLLVVSAPSLSTPPTVRNLFVAAGLAPMIRLAQPLISPRLIPGLYALGGLYALDTLREPFAGAPLIEQALLMLEALLGAALLGWALAGKDLRRSAAQTAEATWVGALWTGAGLLFLILATGLAAGVLGYIPLARLLVAGVLASGILALELAAAIQVLGGLLAFALRVWPLRRLQLVRNHRLLLETRGYRLLVWLAVGGWLIRWLDYIGLFQPALSFTETLLSARFERGSISLSLGDVVAFFLTIWTAYLLSTFIRFVLQEDVYPRRGIPQGSSYAISSLLHYAILTLGFLVGLGMLGMDFAKVSVLLGALGVGIGFGLQSVVNNFISGLILLFERPIHVGDTIEVGDLQGEVRRIGIRASTVRTGQGADIIVPNAQFISANVTNWTLRDQLRRIDLPVGVNYGASPRRVIELLETVARADSRVLRDPPPQGFFVSYGDNSINFELRAWIGRFADGSQIRSDLNAALYDAVYAAGLSFPFPQREVRLLPESEGGPPLAAPAAG